ncbi:MAG: hypothetical protein ABR606_09275 [Vicinamibacterales bacterium]
MDTHPLIDDRLAIPPEPRQPEDPYDDTDDPPAGDPPADDPDIELPSKREDPNEPPDQRAGGA